MAAPLRCSYSSLRTYQDCQRKYYYMYVRRLQPVGRQTALEFGSAWHAAMETWHRSGDLEAALQTFTQQYADDETDTLRTHATGGKMLKAYALRWPRPELFEVVTSEEWLEVPMAGLHLVAKIDKRVRQDGQEFPLEHKTTTSQLNGRYLDTFSPNLQLKLYVWLVGLATGTTPSKVLLDLAYVGRTAPKYGEAFLRTEVPIEPWEVSEVEATVLRLATDLRRRDPTTPEAWLPNFGACHQYGGCPFRHVCRASPAVRETALADAFTVRPPQEPPDGSDA